MQTLENQVAQLEALNSSMSLKLAVVEKERAIFAAREADMNRRIVSLEASLQEAHDALMTRASAGVLDSGGKPVALTQPGATSLDAGPHAQHG